MNEANYDDYNDFHDCADSVFAANSTLECSQWRRLRFGAVLRKCQRFCCGSQRQHF